MPRLKTARKLSDQGVAKTLYLKFGTVRKAERKAKSQSLSLSAYVERLLSRELEEKGSAEAA